MTRDEFDAKYRLHKPVAGGGVGIARSFFGQSRLNKAVVLAHFLGAGTRPSPQETLARIEALGPEDRALVLETCEVDGTTVVVTQFIFEFTSFEAWLASRGPAPARAEPPPASAPGEFTRLFGKQATPAAAAPPARSEAPTERIERGAPGEFTKLFKGSPAPEPKAKPSPGSKTPGPGATPASPRPAEPAKPEPGEFTRLFGAPVPPQAAAGPSPAWSPPASPPSAPPPTSQPVFPEPSPPADDLARRLERGVELPPVPPRAAPVESTARSPQQETPRTPTPGDFTRVFGSAGQPPQVTGPAKSPAVPRPEPPPRPPEAPPPPPSRDGPGGRPSTDYLARLHGAEPASPAGSPLGSPPQRTPPTAGGPSEFTKALQRISISRASVQAEVPEPEPAEARPALVVVLIVCGVLLVLGLAVVLYFLLTKR